MQSRSQSNPSRLPVAASHKPPPSAAMLRNFPLGDQDPDSGLFIRRKFRGDRKAASPGNKASAGQDRPPFTFPPTDALFVQQAFQLVRFAMARGPELVAWAPVSQYDG